MQYPTDFIEKVRAANDLVDIIGSHTELREKGDRLWGRCPFPDHTEKTPSFSVSPIQQLYYCFGCKKGGNLYTFLETYNGFSFRESVEFLARRASIALPDGEDTKRLNSARGKRDVLAKINMSVAVYFHKKFVTLPADHPAKVYATMRGLNQEIVEKFRLGVATEEWSGLVGYLAKNKINLKQAETLGLIKGKKAKRDEYFDTFRDRVMFPIFSPTQDVLGFGGRTFTDSVPKYLNSPETPLFSKGKVLYGLHETGKFIRSEDCAIVVEGYMDLLALYSVGIKNVVAILGTALTAEHAKLIKRFTQNVILLLDGDEAGLNAAERSLPVLLQAGLFAKAGMLNNGQDPDEFLKTVECQSAGRSTGASELNEHLKNSPELFSFIRSRWMSDYRGAPSDKIALLERLAPILKIMANSALRELYITEIADALGEDFSWTRRTLMNIARKLNPPGAKAGPIQDRPNPKVDERVKSDGERRNERDLENSKARLQPEAHDDQNGDQSEDQKEDQHDDHKDEPIIPKFMIRGAPKDEVFVLSLMLTARELLDQAVRNGIHSIATHDGMRQVYDWCIATYRQKPEDFDRLAASLASKIDEPSILTASLEFTHDFSLESEPSTLHPVAYATGSSVGSSSGEHRYNDPVFQSEFQSGSLDGSQDRSKSNSPMARSKEEFESGVSSVKSNLAFSLGDNETRDLSEDKRLMTDYMTAIRKRHLKLQAKALASQIRSEASPEKLEQFMNIQRNRHSLERE